jgi:hypothetical protein
MDQRDRRFKREIGVILIVKILAITALWWCFVLDVRVAVDTTTTAQHFGTSALPPQHPTQQGNSHDQ